MTRKTKEKQPIQITATLYKGEARETLVEEINKNEQVPANWIIIDADLIWEIFDINTQHNSEEFKKYIIKIKDYVERFIKKRFVGNDCNPGIFFSEYVWCNYLFRHDQIMTGEKMSSKLESSLFGYFKTENSETYDTFAISPQALEFIRATKCNEKFLEEVGTITRQTEEKFPKHERYNWIISRFWQNHRPTNDKNLAKEVISLSVRFLPCFVNDFLQEYYSYLVSIGGIRDFTPNKMKLRNTLVKIIFDLRKELPEITYEQMKTVGTEYEDVNYTPEFTAENIANQTGIYNKTEINKAMKKTEYLFDDEKLKEIKAEIKERFIRWIYSLRASS